MEKKFLTNKVFLYVKRASEYLRQTGLDMSKTAKQTKTCMIGSISCQG